MFDDPTRVAMRSNSATYGTAFAGRGPALNQTFAGLESLMRELEPAMRTIASQATEFDEFFPALEQAAAEAAPVADVQAVDVGGARHHVQRLGVRGGPAPGHDLRRPAGARHGDPRAARRSGRS